MNTKRRIEKRLRKLIRSTIDWASVDWSQQDCEIAERLQTQQWAVQFWRKKLRKPQSKYWHRKRGFAALLERWSKLDWRQTNVVLARQMKVTGERARQIRRLLGKPNATIKAPPPSVMRRLRLVEANLDQLRGLTVREAAKALGITLGPRSAARQFLDARNVLRHGVGKHPWQAMNFELGNSALGRIWRIGRFVIAQRRERHDHDSLKWSGRVYGHSAKSHDPRYRRLIVAEQAKARKFRRSFSTRSTSRKAPGRKPANFLLTSSRR